MGFLSPWFLAGLAAVGLPLWLHLLQKHRNTPLPFSSLMFFEKRTQSSVKHRRLRYLMLLSLRIALLALLAIAFAQPYINRNILPLSRSGEVTLIAVDNSLSMRAADRLDAAKREAKSVIAGLKPEQRAEVITFGSHAQAMSEVTADHAPLSAAVDAIEPSDGRTSFSELARAARSMARSLKLPVKLVFISDMQQSGMPSNFADLRLNEDVRLEPRVIGKQQPNFAVENVVAPRRVYDAKKTRVMATIAGYGAGKATRTATLLLNGREVESHTVEVPEIGRATVEFLNMDVPFGRNKGEVRIDSADALPADDRFYFSVERADPRHALFVHEAGDSRALLYFRAALEASGQAAFQMDEATPEQCANVAPSKYAFVVLSDVGNLPGAFETELRRFVRDGGAVLSTLGRNSASRARTLVSDAPIEGARYSGREGALFQTAAWLDASHPAVQNNNRWDDVKFYQAIHVQPGAARVAVKLSDETPLLIDQQEGAGRVLVFASTFDNVANDFPVHATFVPFVEQLARYLGQLQGGAASVPVGSFAELREGNEGGAAVDVLDPAGRRVLSLSEGASAQNIQFTEAGFYEIHRPGRDETVAVNADRRESDLTPTPAETLALWKNTSQGGTAASGAAEASEGRKPLPLWWYVALLAMAAMVAESVIGNRHLPVDKEAA